MPKPSLFWVTDPGEDVRAHRKALQSHVMREYRRKQRLDSMQRLRASQQYIPRNPVRVCQCLPQDGLAPKQEKPAEEFEQALPSLPGKAGDSIMEGYEVCSRCRGLSGLPSSTKDLVFYDNRSAPASPPWRSHRDHGPLAILGPGNMDSFSASPIPMSYNMQRHLYYCKNTYFTLIVFLRLMQLPPAGILMYGVILK